MAPFTPAFEEGLELGGCEVEPVQRIDRSGADRQRHIAVADPRENAMLVRTPRGEGRQVAHDPVAGRVEHVRTVAMDAYPVLVERIVRVPADVVARVDDEHRRVALRSQPLGQDAARKSGAHD